MTQRNTHIYIFTEIILRINVRILNIISLNIYIYIFYTYAVNTI